MLVYLQKCTEVQICGRFLFYIFTEKYCIFYLLNYINWAAILLASESSCIENMTTIALNVLKVQSAEMHAECHITFIVFNINYSKCVSYIGIYN